jgi:hypothetical protein
MNCLVLPVIVAVLVPITNQLLDTKVGYLSTLSLFLVSLLNLFLFLVKVAVLVALLVVLL